MEDAIRSFLERYRSTEDLGDRLDFIDESAVSGRLMPSTAMVAAPPARMQRGRVDGARAVQMVEKAADLIREYEHRFQVIEADARSFVRRVDGERATLSARIETLQMQLSESERRNQALETALQDTKTLLLESRLERQTADSRLEACDADILRSAAYFSTIEEKLAGLL